METKELLKRFVKAAPKEWYAKVEPLVGDSVFVNAPYSAYEIQADPTDDRASAEFIVWGIQELKKMRDEARAQLVKRPGWSGESWVELNGVLASSWDMLSAANVLIALTLALEAEKS